MGQTSDEREQLQSNRAMVKVRAFVVLFSLVLVVGLILWLAYRGTILIIHY